MNVVAALFASGRVADLILAFTLLEFVLIVVHRRRTGRGVAPSAIAGTLLSGAFLMVALRCALAQAPWRWVALCLAGSLAAHLVDLRRRWR